MLRLVEPVKTALKQWRNAPAGDSPFADLLLFRRAMQARSHSSGSPPNSHQVTNELLYQALQELSADDADAAQLLEARYLDNGSIRSVALQRNVSESYLYKQINAAIGQLAGILEIQENQLRQEKRMAWLDRIDSPSYANLIGIESHQQKLYKICTQPEPPWLISVEGIGGIGKTSLTHSVIMQVVEECLFDEIGWVSAKPEQLSPIGVLQSRPNVASQAQTLLYQLVLQLSPETPAAASLPIEQLLSILRRQLETGRHLIVIDNLETVDDVEALLPHLEALTNPSRFVLTSRKQTVSAQQSVYRFVVPELSEADALTLIRQEAEWSNLPVLSQMEDGQLRPIFAHAGGHPLALRLIVGLAHANPLDAILSDLQNAQGESTENLYRFIYRCAWESLDEVSQRILLFMPIVKPSGDTAEYIAQVTGVSESQLRHGLTELNRFNLVNTLQSPQEVRYSIHSLTRTFLLRETIEWK